ncbi:beta-galactosidase-1-like protein 2 [Amphiura filiformis]|uniref:beta-galactosidase-1-like protein 2 n=1 Tax=Amphiura filiformis TaxID=82378 RepID=UPI003B21A2BC
MQRNGIRELLITSDNNWKHLNDGSVDGVFMTINFQSDVEKNLGFLTKLQGDDKPKMVMEFWSGWFDHWAEGHHVLDTEPSKNHEGMSNLVKGILQHKASINFYMFHGGTNFGFWNGGNHGNKNKEYMPTITSYDYDAPLSEAGDTTSKFFTIKELFKSYAPKGSVPDNLPKVPTQIGNMAYPTTKVTHYMTLDNILELVGSPIKNEKPLNMEKLPINRNGGQGYGFLLYRTTVKSKPGKMLLANPPQDRAQIFLNGQDMGVLDRINDDDQKVFEFNTGRDGDNTLELLVENMGRVNYGKFLNGERKETFLVVENMGRDDQKVFEFNTDRDGDNLLELLVENMGRVNYGKFLNGERKGKI